LAATLIERFGAQSLYGRTLGLGEARRILFAESIVEAHRARARSGDWAEWASANPQHAQLLNWANRISDGDDFD